MDKLAIYCDLGLMAPCGYRICLLKDENDKSDGSVVCESTFSMADFMHTHPSYKKAMIVRTKKERGVLTLYVIK